MSRTLTFPCAGGVAQQIVVGRGTPAPGAHTELAIKIYDAARAMGFQAVSFCSSAFRQSNSRFVSATDRRGRKWKIRVANHTRPERSSIPNLELISADGTSGLEEAREFLRHVMAGEVPWFDSAATVSPVPEKARKRINRCR